MLKKREIPYSTLPNQKRRNSYGDRNIREPQTGNDENDINFCNISQITEISASNEESTITISPPNMKLHQSLNISDDLERLHLFHENNTVSNLPASKRTSFTATKSLLVAHSLSYNNVFDWKDDPMPLRSLPMSKLSSKGNQKSLTRTHRIIGNLTELPDDYNCDGGNSLLESVQNISGSIIKSQRSKDSDRSIISHSSNDISFVCDHGEHHCHSFYRGGPNNSSHSLNLLDTSPIKFSERLSDSPDRTFLLEEFEYINEEIEDDSMETDQIVRFRSVDQVEYFHLPKRNPFSQSFESLASIEHCTDHRMVRSKTFPYDLKDSSSDSDDCHLLRRTASEPCTHTTTPDRSKRTFTTGISFDWFETEAASVDIIQYCSMR